MKSWHCLIGEVDAEKVPDGADYPMRRAIEKAYYEITGEMPEFIFSGWNGKPDKIQREIINHTRLVVE